jgi:hypothetical protein
MGEGDIVELEGGEDVCQIYAQTEKQTENVV